MRAQSLFMALLAVTSSACKTDKAAAGASLPSLEAKVAVQTIEVTAKQVPRYLTLTGSLTANQESEVAANASGVVQKTLVERGSFVRNGEVLAMLDVRTAELNRAEAQANLETARQQQKLAQGDCERAKGLLERGAMTQQEYDRTMSQCATTLSAADAALARAHLAEKTLGDSQVRSPFAGLVSERYVSVGEYVGPQTKVAHVLELDPLRLSLTVPEQDIGSIQQGLAVDFSVATFPDRHFVGEIRYVGPAVRAQTRDLVVEAVVANKNRELRPGMFATAKVTVGQQTLAVVPKSTLRVDESTQRVFVVSGGHLEERILELGDDVEGGVSVVKGLKGGETIVAAPSEQLADGLDVQATPLAAR